MRLIKTLMYLNVIAVGSFCYYFILNILDDPFYSSEVELLIMVMSIVACSVLGWLYIIRKNLYKSTKSMGTLATAKMVRSHALMVAIGFVYLSAYMASMMVIMVIGRLNIVGIFGLLGFVVSLGLGNLYLEKKKEANRKR